MRSARAGPAQAAHPRRHRGLRGAVPQILPDVLRLHQGHDQRDRRCGGHRAEYLHEMLEKVDPESAEQIHFHNIKRVIRALEYYQQTGQKISEHNEAEREKESAYNSAYFVLTDDRKILYDRIDKRVDLMMQEGLLEEVNALRLRGLKRESVAMQGLGYKELFGYFEGEYPLEEAVRIIKRDTRHFAKRQLTWFRRERDVIWLDKSEIGREDKQLIQQMLTVLKEKEIIH